MGKGGREGLKTVGKRRSEIEREKRREMKWTQIEEENNKKNKNENETQNRPATAALREEPALLVLAIVDDDTGRRVHREVSDVLVAAADDGLAVRRPRDLVNVSATGLDTGDHALGLPVPDYEAVLVSSSSTGDELSVGREAKGFDAALHPHLRRTLQLGDELWGVRGRVPHVDRWRLLLALALHASRGADLSVGVHVDAADVVLVSNVVPLRVTLRVVDYSEAGGGPDNLSRRKGVDVSPCLCGEKCERVRAFGL